MSDPQALHVTRNVIPGKLGVDLHLHRVHIPLVSTAFSSTACRRPPAGGKANRLLGVTNSNGGQIVNNVFVT